jgi:hypothetical protein
MTVGEEPDCNYKLWLKAKEKAEARIFGFKSAGGIQTCVSSYGKLHFGVCHKGGFVWLKRFEDFSICAVSS